MNEPNLFYARLMPSEIDPENELAARYFISYSLICIGLLFIFCVLNIITKFHLALLIDIAGIISYSTTLFFFRRNLDLNKACGIFVFNCCFILVTQCIILEFNAYHNMFFYPAVSIFCFSLFNNKKYSVAFFSLTFLSALASYFIPKYFDTTIWYLTDQEKDSFVILTMIASLAATYKIGEIVFEQKKEAFDKLKVSNAQLDELNQKNKKILQLIIHDISNPLSQINMILNQVKYKDIEEIQKISQRSAPAIKTINEIINISREMMALEDGKIRLELHNIDLLKVVEYVRDSFQEELNKKNINITINNAVKGSVFIIADEKSLKASVLNNVLSNAIKFSHKNSVINFELSEQKESILLKISDTGIGIPENLINKIFKAEEMTSRYGTEGERGTGYGLPLVKAFIESYQGAILCESEEQRGTTITLMFKRGSPL